MIDFGAAMNEQRISDENLDAWKRRVQQNAANPAVVTDLRDALLRILGDKPAPHEDPYERCRQIAADTLGYPAPAPMQATDQTQRALLQAMNDVQQRALAQQAQQNATNPQISRSYHLPPTTLTLQLAALNPRAWNSCRQGAQDAENVELVPHGELAALKERDKARAEVIRLNQTVDQLLSWNDKHIAEKASIADELASLRSRVSERDASIVNAIRTGKAFRHV